MDRVGCALHITQFCSQYPSLCAKPLLEKDENQWKCTSLLLIHKEYKIDDLQRTYKLEYYTEVLSGFFSAKCNHHLSTWP